MDKTAEKLVLLDSNSLLHRAYHALPDLMKKDGSLHTGAIYGFLSILLGIIAKEQPTHIGAAFDVHAPTFRHLLYDKYKATRKPMDDALREQFEPLKNILGLMGIKVITLPGYEGDDILGTLSARWNVPTVIVTGDRDSLQLVSDSTRVCLNKRGISDIVMYDLATLAQDGFTPSSFIDYKALCGDTSDNIPGVSGVGEKTAKTLLDTYGTLENVLAHASEIKGKLGEKIAASQDVALLCKRLATIECNAPIECSLDELSFLPIYGEEVRSALKDLEMTSLFKRMQFVGGSETIAVDGEKVLEEVKSEKQTPLHISTEKLNSEQDIKNCVQNAEKIAIVANEGLRFAVDGQKEYVCEPQEDLFSEGLDWASALCTLLSSVGGKKVVFYDAKLCYRQSGIWIENCDDVMLMAHLAYGGMNVKSFARLCEMEDVAESPCSLFDLADKYRKILSDNGESELYSDVELPLAKVLGNMEQRGFSVNIGALEALSEKYERDLKEVTARIYQLAGNNSFNISSTKQLAKVLFEDLQLKRGRKNKSGYSVDEEVLTELIDEHPIVSEILEYRRLSKMLSTYVNGMRPLVKQGKIHTELNQCITATGRLSSTNPNLQNIPVRKQESKEIKEMFEASEGNVLVSADYSQIELRLMAHFSGDPTLQRAFANGEDIHRATAAEIMQVPPEAVTDDMRRDAKAVNFGIIYGISDFGLATNLSIPVYRAKEYIEKYFATHPLVKDFMNGCVTFAKENGYCKTLLGRRRAMPEINSSKYPVRAAAERMAMNSPLQGSAADIVKLAMLKVEKRLESMKSKMILQVHDELIVDASADEVEQVCKVLTEEMENAYSLSVPLTVNVGIGKNWSELK